MYDMGLHDTFRNQTPIVCPLDGAAVSEWQDEDGGSMITWLEGRVTPLEADNPDPDAWFGDRSADRLPPFFGLRAYHGDHHLSALGETDANDTWSSMRLVEVRASVLVPGEFWPPFREGEAPTPRFDSMRLWREGVGLDTANVERLRLERERLRAELPAHGGNATCRLEWSEEGRSPAVAIILGYPGFVCVRHLAEHKDGDPGLVLR